MQKRTKLGILGALVAIGVIAGYSMQQQPIGCPISKEIITLGTGTNRQFSIVLPNGDHKCHIIVSKENYTKLQNNVGIMTVGDRVFDTDRKITHNYCEIAKWAFIGHLNYFDDITKKFENYLFPRECTAEIWPSLKLPHWYLKVWNWYEQDLVSESEILNGLRYLTKL